MIPILFLAADPSDASRLRIGEEIREIRERLQLARQRDRFLLEQRHSVRPMDISQALLDVEPEIVHFSGHGASTGAICVEGPTGKVQEIDAAALGALFELFSSRVRCVVLNACYSAVQAQQIARHIPFVIGMRRAIGDRAAVAFSVGFYQAIAAGRPIAESFRFGCAQVTLHGIPEGDTPVLLESAAESVLRTSPTPSESTLVRAPAVARPFNLGFDGPLKDGVPSGWFNSLGCVDFVSTRYEIVTERREDKDGCCVRLRLGQAEPGEFGSLMQRSHAAFLAGRTVRLEGEARTQGLGAWAGFWIRADSDREFNLFFDNMSSRPIRGTTPWSRYAIDAQLAENVTWLNYGLVMMGRGTMWADNLHLRVWQQAGCWEDV